MENSKIQWTHHTFNPWRGCTKVSAGCAHCYAETMSRRNPEVLGIWGDDGTRVVASEAMWREPMRWNAAAEAAGERHRVFCASLADICEDRLELTQPRLRLKRLIHDTPHLDWLLLSKRPENYLRLFWGPDGVWPSNVWAGTSIENQDTAEERMPHLLRVPAVVRFLSIEPLLGPVDLVEAWGKCLKGSGDPQWVIVGGESGGKSRPCNIAWIRDIVKQCKAARCPVFVKQLGRRFIIPNDSFSKWQRDGDVLINYDQREGSRYQGELIEVGLNDPKGGTIEEWPEDLRVREFPSQSATCRPPTTD